MLRVALYALGAACVSGKVVGLHDHASDEFKANVLDKLIASRVQARFALTSCPCAPFGPFTLIT